MDPDGGNTAAMFTLIGDLVGSRSVPDRGRAQAVLEATLREVNGSVLTVQVLEPTVGDEFQGAFATLAAATRATLLVRLALLPALDVRCGLGLGPVTVHDATRRPLLQDGPGWWSARAAVQALGQRRHAAARTWYAVDRDVGGPPPGLVNAHLVCRDALVDRLPERGWRMLRLSLLGETQRRIAEVEQITPSAVSQQFARGIGAVREAQALLEGDR
jgi:hypothetical protein